MSQKTYNKAIQALVSSYAVQLLHGISPDFLRDFSQPIDFVVKDVHLASIGIGHPIRRTFTIDGQRLRNYQRHRDNLESQRTTALIMNFLRYEGKHSGWGSYQAEYDPSRCVCAVEMDSNRKKALVNVQGIESALSPISDKASAKFFASSFFSVLSGALPEFKVEAASNNIDINSIDWSNAYRWPSQERGDL